MTNFRQTYDELLNKTEERLLEYIKIIEPKSIYEPFRYIISSGGKRIRPVLTMIAAGALGEDPLKALDAGVAIEILHNFTLVHDDIMDKSPMRRGKPTVHTKWDEPTAILTGDVMIGWAYNLLPKPYENQRSREIFQAFTSGLIEVCEGQAYDMDFNIKRDVSIEDYILMIGKKTAKILETCTVIGAHCGEGNTLEVESLRDYAFNLGIAFQIQDDLLDLTADEKELGKMIGKDINEGKKTLLIVKALECAQSEPDKAILNKFMELNGLPQEYVPQIQEMFKRLGVLDFAESEADKYFRKAKNALDSSPCNYYIDMLQWLADSLIKRKF